MVDNTTNKNTKNKIEDKDIPEQFKGIDYNLIMFFNNFATKDDLKDLKNDIDDDLKDLKNDIDKKFKTLYWIIGIAFTVGFGAVFSLLNTIFSELHDISSKLH